MLHVRGNEKPELLDFQAFFETAPALLLVLDPQLRIVAVSDEYTKSTRTKRSEIVGRPLFEVFPENPGDPTSAGIQKAMASFQRVLQNRTADVMPEIRQDIPLPEAEGGGYEERYWLPVSSPVLAPDGSVAYIIHRVDDVTKLVKMKKAGLDREIANQALRESEERLRLFIEYAPAALAIFDKEMCYLGASRRWRSDYQIAERDIVGRCHYDLFPEMPEEWKDAHRRGLSGEIVREDEDQFVRTNGQIQSLKWEIRPWRLADNSVGGIVIFAEDITEQVTAKRTLKERKERLRAILDTVGDAIITIDHLGLINSINPSAEKMFGYSRDELLGQNVKILMPPPYRDEHDGYLARYRETGEPRIIGVGRELTGLRKDGSLFPIELAVSMVDHLNLYTGVIRDISERKELQKHVLEIASDEQRRIGQELHDGIQQELTGLSLFAGVLSDGLKNAGEGKSTDVADRNLKQEVLAKLQRTSQRLTEGLKATTKHVQEISHGIMPVQLDSEGLQDALQSLALSLNSEHVQCRFEFANPTAIVVSNTAASHLYRIAQEAVTNSMRHGRATKIQISLSASRATLELEVSDNGTGFDPAIEGASKGPNAGMGRRIMEYRASMIGGVVRFERREEGGMRMVCSVLCGVPEV